MLLNVEDDNLIRRYLLGELRRQPELLEQVEQRLLAEDDFIVHCDVIEAELIEAYVGGRLSATERAAFERHFSLTPQRRQQLALTMALQDYAATKTSASARPSKPAPSWWNWRPTVFAMRWQAVVCAFLLLAAGWGIWKVYLYQSPVEKGLTALNKAYLTQRPLAGRISGFAYAPFRFSTQRGTNNSEDTLVDYVALEQAKHNLFEAIGKDKNSTTLHALGKYYLTQLEFELAIEQLKQALLLAPEDAQLHGDLGAALLGKIERDSVSPAEKRVEDVNECLEHLNRALQLNPSLLEALFNRALVRQRERLRRESRSDWERYLQSDPDSQWGQEARRNLQILESDLSKSFRRKEELYQDCVSALQADDDERALAAFALSYSFKGNYVSGKLADDFLNARLNGRTDSGKESLRLLTKLGSLAQRKTGDRFTWELARYYRQASASRLALVAQARQRMGEAQEYYQNSENDRAVQSYTEARHLFEEAHDTGEAYLAVAWMGHCEHQRSNTEQNLRIFTWLALVCADKQYRWMQAHALCGKANGDNAAGLFSRAIEDSRQCGQIAASLGDKTGVLRSKYMLGAFHHTLGKHQENLSLAEQGRDLADELAADIPYAITFYNLSAWSLSALGLHDLALAFQAEAINMAKADKSPRLLAYAQIFQGVLLARDKRYNDAVTSVQRGIEIGEALNADSTGQDFVHQGLLQLGQIYREAGRLTEAEAALNKVVLFFQQTQNHDYFYSAAKSRLLTLMAQGDDLHTGAELAHVLETYEKYRRSIQEESNRDSFFDQEQGIYDIAIDFAYSRLRDEQQAFNYAEHSRARSLLDLWQGGWRMVVSTETPDLKITTQAPPLSGQEVVQAMPAQTQLLEYAVLEDKIIGWVVTDAGIVSRVIPVTKTALNERVQRYMEFISHPPKMLDEQWQGAATSLYEVLIQPLESLLDRQKSLCIIPDKLLTQVPFGALRAGATGRLLLEDYTLHYAASANLFLLATEQARRKAGRQPEHLLAVGNPSFDQIGFPQLTRLPTAETEAVNIAACYEAPTVLLREQATKDAVLRELQHADVAHFALHYVPDPWSPMLSRVPLAVRRSGNSESVLQLFELYQFQTFRPRLVVLAACQTRGEDFYAGEGAIGITRPFEAAGVPLIVASLWSVDTQATEALMKRFHRTRRGEGQSTVAALRATQLEFFHSEEYQHPYYWAPFIVLGGYSTF